MPSQDEFVASLFQYPLVQILSTCARRLKLRFALRGGVLRNHLLTLASGDEPPETLYDYVDPFSDIDLVLNDLNDWPSLAKAISESVPYSGFHRWEVIAEDALRTTSKQFASIAPDRLMIWLDGTSGKATQLSIAGLDIDPEETIRYPNLFGRPLGERPILAPPFTYILDLLRLARYAFAFPRVKSEFDLSSFLRDINVISRFAPYGRPTAVDSSDLRRLEVALLDLLFTAHDWDIASGFAKATVTAIPHQWYESSGLLRTLAEGAALSAGTGIGALLYKEGPQSPRSIQLFTDSTAPPPELGDTKSLIPWVRINSYGHTPDNCCNYRDFENGVATVAWRTKTSERTLAQISPTQIALQAAVEPLTQHESAIFRHDPAMLSLPGFVHKSQSFTVRVDHGFVRGYLNRNASFHLGIAFSELPSTE
jgi:hypothetical protein